jgi:hypothetical protein
MMKTPEPKVPAETVADGTAPKHALYYVGTLVYSRAGLAWVFMWLLWGDFCFTMMETVVPSIVPLRLRELDAPNWVLGVILVTVPSVLNVLLNPIISTTSDRHRGRFGRRIPFMMFSVPFISLALCLMAFSTEIGHLVHSLIGGATGWSSATVIIGVIAVAMMTFKFTDMFVNTVFWYLFNDVVPQAVMARFLGLFRMIGAAVGVIYNYVIFEYALSHMRLILLVVAGLYFVGFGLMCFIVKEGQYPPPAKFAGERRNIFVVIKAYAGQCLGHRIYRLFYMHNMFWSLSNACWIFLVFLKLSLGLTLAQIGTIAAGVGVVNFCLTYPAGALADRFHPLRVMLWIKVGLLAVAPLNLIWIFTRFSPDVNFNIILVLLVFNIPLSLIYQAVTLPMYMRLLPKNQYGQFCSFNAICTAAVGALGGVLGGLYIDLMRHFFPDATWGKDFYYRFAPVWPIPFLAMGLFLLVLLYREWKKLGGEAHYVPPDSGDINQEIVPERMETAETGVSNANSV